MKLCLYICCFALFPLSGCIFNSYCCVCVSFLSCSVSLFRLIFDYLIVPSPLHTLLISILSPASLPSFVLIASISHTFSLSLTFPSFVVSFLLLQISILNVHTRPTLLEIEKHILLNIEKYL